MSGVELASAYVTLKAKGDELGPSVRRSLSGVERESARTGTRSGQKLAAGMSKGADNFSRDQRGRLRNASGQYVKAGEQAGQGYQRGLSKAAGGNGSSFLKTFAGLGLGAAAVGVTKWGLGIAAANEQARISFTTMLGSAQRADAFLKKLQNFAASTPFEFPELQQAASSLISAGINANKVIPIMTTLGDVTSGMGTGSEGVQRATIALQQMNAAGRITGEDLNQLRDAGIPVYDLLAKATGKSKAEVVKLAQAGKLGKKELGQMLKALETGKGLERFSGLMDKQSQSLTGLISTFKDTAGLNLAKGLEPLIPLIKDGLGEASQFLADELPKASAALADFIHDAQAGKGTAGDLVDVFQATVDVAHGVLSFFNGLPGPVKKFAVEGLIAYAAISKLNAVAEGSKLVGFIGQLANSQTRLDAVGKASYRLGAGLRTAAGAAGLLLLTNGLQKADTRLGTFETTLGGALAGFSVGGPWGALIGGIGGFFSTALVGSDKAQSSLHSYIDTLDQASAKITELTRKQALKAITGQTGVEEAGTMNAGAQAGISQRQMVDAITGQVAAFTKVKGQVAAAVSKGLLTESQGATFLNFLKQQRTQLGANKEQILANNAATRTFSSAIKSLPKRVQTDIKTNGMEKTRKAIVDLTRKYHLNPKAVATLIRENGGTPTKKKIESIIAAAQRLDRQHPTPSVNVHGGPEALRLINGVSGALANLNGKRANTYVTHHDTTIRDLLTPGQHKKRAGGGPVRAGQAYTVGEFRRETFIPNTSGRIIPTADGGGGSAGISGPVTLMVGDREMQAWFEDAYDAEQALG